MVKAAICREFGQKLTIENVVLASPGPHDLLIDVKACAICHSDISFAQGAWGGELPTVYGHEASGIVREAGSSVSKFKPGDRVVITLIRSCGTCHYCAGGSQVLCEEVFDLDRKSPIATENGDALHQAMRSGAFAEQIVVHESQIAKIPDEMTYEVASLIACGVITGIGAVTNSADLKPGQSAVVIGCGGVGLNSIQGAALSGADPIVAIDTSAAKLDVAGNFGATHGFNPMEVDGAAAVLEITDGRGADFVFVTVGSINAIESAARYITKKGTVVIVGMPASGLHANYDPSLMAAWNQRIVGSKMGDSVVSRDIPAVIDAWQEGKLKLEELITGRYTLDRINEAMESTLNGETLRNVILFD